MGDEYSGSGHFVGESTVEPSAPAPAKKSSIQERKSKGVEVKDPNPQAVATNVNQTLEAMGPLNPPIGEVVSGVADQAISGVKSFGNKALETIKENPITSTIVGVGAGAGGLYAAWRALNNNKPPDDNNPPNNKWDRTVAGRPANATLVAPVPTLTEAVPSAPVAAPTAPVPSTSTTPPATFPAQATQQPRISGYKTTTGNLIEGAPNPIMGAAPAPAEIAPEPVKPLDPVTQAKVDSIAAEQRRKDAAEVRAAEAHANEQRRKDEIHELNKAKQAEKKIQESQGKAASPTSVDEQGMALEKLNAKNQLANSVAKASKQPPTTAPVTVAPPVTTPVTTPVSTPAVTTPAPEVTPTITETPEKVAAKKQATEKAILGTETAKPAKWPGGAEGSALQLFGGTKKNFTPESQASLEMFKDYVGGQLTMPPSGGSIHQIDQASKFYEKYTGKPLPRSPEGKLVPIPEAQIKELHAGINTELSDAIKGNKLGPLGKGALAAAALLGLTEAVQAAQKGDFGPLRQAGFDIGGPIAAGKLGLGLLSKAGGAGFSALTYTGGLNENEGRDLAQRRYKFEQESQKLGSPFRSVPPPR